LCLRGWLRGGYAAALPPWGAGRGGVVLGPMPFAGVVWRGDVEMMGVDDLQNVVGGQAAVEALPKLVELIHHKKPVGSVLIIDGDGDLVGVVDGIQAKVSLASQISVCGGRGYDGAKESPRVKKLEYPEGGTDDMAASLGVGKQDLVVFTVKETARLLHDKDLLATYASLFDAGSKGLCHVDGEESIRQLRRHLEGAGFSVSNEFPLGGQSIIIFSLRSEKEVEVEEESHPKINLVYSNLHSAPPLALADALAKQGLAVEIKTLESESDVEGLLVGTATKKNSPLTLLYNPAGTMLSRPDPTTFAALKALLPSGSPTLWLTAGVNGGQCTSAATVAGFLRVVREEEKMANVRVLDFDKHETFASVAKAVGAILRTDGNGGENEYWLHKGVVHVSRIVPNLRLCDRMDVVERAAVEAPLPVDKALRGRLINGDGVVFTHNEVLEKSTPADGEVDIQVESTELYKGDVQAVTPEERTRLVCGKVVAIGAGVEKAMLGKSVVGFVRASNPYDTVVRSQATLSVECESESGAVLLSLLPSLCEAAAALELGSGAALEQKQVLLLPTTKSLGRAFSLLSARLGFGLTVVEDGGNLSGIYQAMETSGSSLVIAAAAFSPLASDLWRRIPSGGASFCLMDGGASLSTTALDTTPFTRGARFSTTSIASILGSSTPESATTIQKILSVVVPVAQEATSTLDSQQSQILTLNSLRSPISFPPDTPTILSYTYNSPTTPIKLTPPPFTLQFSDSGIYLLVGCLGGLGRSLASFLTARGARHLAFISRSGSSSASASALIDSITATTGVTPLVFRGDASDVNDVSRVVRSIRDSGRTIKGVVHAAMVLQDGILSNMTTDKMDASLRPKVDGAYALREVLEAEGADGELDFFVMTSSISATVGQPGQANYAAGNAVLDSVAVQMGRRGKAGVYTSLVLPMVLGVGVVAENDELEGKIARRGMYGIDEGEMLRAFEAAMSMSMGGGVSSEGVQMDAAIVLGLDPTRLAGTWAAAEAEDMAVETSWMSDDARFSHLRQISDAVLGKDESGGGAKKSGGGGGFAEQVADAHASGGFEAALVVTAGCIMTKCGSVLMLPADGFELDGRSVASYGLDSMVGAELRNWLFKELGLNIAFQDLLATTLSFRGLSKLVLDGFGISE
jgi:short-subunit dehydrogenase